MCWLQHAAKQKLHVARFSELFVLQLHSSSYPSALAATQQANIYEGSHRLSEVLSSFLGLLLAPYMVVVPFPREALFHRTTTCQLPLACLRRELALHGKKLKESEKCDTNRSNPYYDWHSCISGRSHRPERMVRSLRRQPCEGAGARWGQGECAAAGLYFWCTLCSACNSRAKF